MKHSFATMLVIAVLLFPISVQAQTSDFGVSKGNSVIWDVEIGTNFTLWYTGGGYCAIENGSTMSFDVSEVNQEVFGILNIGNVTVPANDTAVALDLTLGIWPSWLTGLFVEVGQQNIHNLNESAYAAAERVSGNWMNGTITSRYENISVGEGLQECIVFDYQQDPPGTQITHLAYSLAFGVLVEANTSVTFGSTYKLVLSLRGDQGYPTVVDFSANLGRLIVFGGVVGGGLLAVIVIVYVQLSRKK
ncbi:MAG: hypothetical protein EAX87_03125 [Candidatus Thorarchaeota archaeon]|nr:hypothetical protein [Candidatus Thorarchaeota archaeon]